LRRVTSVPEKGGFNTPVCCEKFRGLFTKDNIKAVFDFFSGVRRPSDNAILILMMWQLALKLGNLSWSVSDNLFSLLLQPIDFPYGV